MSQLQLHVGLGILNDLWLYNVTSGLWTWVSGSNVRNQYGTYGSLGVTTDTNIMGSRSSFAADIDVSNQTLLVFGGGGRTASLTGTRAIILFFCMADDAQNTVVESLTRLIE